ncbi:phosphoserine phosphatase SerB [Parvibium lacunae]|uniref:Phosphoserine phosphatase n=1 Tax=Parvibium lacunae TaxID=1888893 RepID=A0A368L7R3_9BURK|nr:phosphoserine phosphatase SerB [Parvibium lacunae]RCS59693.1 phosphoserine phosphatase SerB [Parvibium lacunae]
MPTLYCVIQSQDQATLEQLACALNQRLAGIALEQNWPAPVRFERHPLPRPHLLAEFQTTNALPASEKAVIDVICDDAQADCTWLAQKLDWSAYGLVAMDMDSTLITIECIDEIADFCGKKAEVAAITEAAMRGEIKDFNESLARRVGLLAGLAANNLEAVYNERLQLSPGAETMLASVQRHGLKTLLVSGGFTFFTEKLQERLGLDYTRANTLEIVDGRLTGRVQGQIVNDEVKAETVQQYCAELRLSTQQTIVMGDGSNDLKMMALAGVSLAFHAKPAVRQAASHRLNHVGLDGILPWFGTN